MTEDCYTEYHRVFNRLIDITHEPESIVGKITSVQPATRVNFSIAAHQLDDKTLILCFDALYKYSKGVGQTSNEIEGHDEVRESKFIDSLILVAQILEPNLGIQGSTYPTRVSNLAQLAGAICSSQIGISDIDVVRGFALRFRLDYRESPDWLTHQHKFVGQHFDLIVENWKLFEERRRFDQDFIRQLASYDGSKPLSEGFL